MVFGQYGGLSAEIELDPRKQPFLFDHQIQGTAVLPGVMGVEAFAEVSKVVLPEWHVVGIEEMLFLAPFKFYRNEPRVLMVNSELQADGDEVIADCRLIGRRSLAKGERVEETLHFTGRVRLAKRPRSVGSLSDPPSTPEEVLESDAIYALYFHGPAYQVLGAAWQNDDQVVGRLSASLPVHHLPGDQHTITGPRLAELCFQTAGLIEFANSERVGLPRRVAQIRLFDPSEERAGQKAVVEKTGAGDYSATVVDEAGNILMEMTGYATIESPMAVDEKPLRALRKILRGSRAGFDS